MTAYEKQTTPTKKGHLWNPRLWSIPPKILGNLIGKEKNKKNKEFKKNKKSWKLTVSNWPPKSSILQFQNGETP